MPGLSNYKGKGESLQVVELPHQKALRILSLPQIKNLNELFNCNLISSIFKDRKLSLDYRGGRKEG